MNSTNPSPKQQTLTLQEAIDLAIQHHTAGDLPKAESIYQQILKAEPDQPVALHYLGVIAYQVGKKDIAVDLINKAIAIKPDYAEAHYNLGIALQELGKVQEASVSYNKAIAIKPGYAEAHNNLGIVLQEQGKMDDAAASYNKALAIKSDYAEAHNNLGTTLQELGKIEEARVSYGKAVAIKPDYAKAHYNLGVVSQEHGKTGDAVASFNKAIAIKPDYAEAFGNLGLAFKEKNELHSAITSYNKAIAIKPDYAEAHYNLGIALQELGKVQEASVSYNKAIAIKPNYAKAHNNLGAVFREQGKIDSAVASFNKALAIKSDYAEAHNNLGTTLQELGKIEEARVSYGKAVAIKPDYAEAHNNLGAVFQEHGKTGDAVASFNKAIAIKPDYAEAHNNLGAVFREQGKIDSAVASFNKALAIKSDYAEAHRHLALMKKHSEYDENIEAMEQTYAKPVISNEQKMHLAFGLGKVYEDLQDYTKAFDFFAEGNSIQRRNYSYSIDEEARFFGKLKKSFCRSLFAQYQEAGCDSEIPIFILGMPRSGTTMVEQILASHRYVYGAGELETLGRTVHSYFEEIETVKFPESVRHIDGADFERAGADYIRAIRRYSGDSRFITDKMPNNFKLVGLIKLMLPFTKIIHCRRNPADTCVSIFKNYFTSTHNYAYNLCELGQYYNLYRDLMEHWHSVIPGFIHDVHYEDLVADQTGQTKALLEYCDLDWDDACLDFHKTDRPVRTASSVQVRQPIYKSSVQSWKRYEKQLAPLLELLDG